ncbi:MAG: DNA-binding response regulator, partial [Caulobacter sp.]|nr:DNA-binding response regulator [Caulobacter sp.]
MEKRILIVDGDAAARSEITGLLSGYGLRVIGAGSAREMDQVLREAPVNLVMLDLL